ncbi:MAG: hypothetical protein WC091_13290 [Sulfuricellaceae bacterium]
MNDIAHAGGTIDGHKYSNSIEAIIRSVSIGFSYIELDVVQLADGFGIAHDGMERSYGVNDFSQVNNVDFLNLKVYGRYTPPQFEQLLEISAKNNITWIFDSKFKQLTNYMSFMSFVNGLKLLNRCIFQAYSLAEATAARDLGARQVIFALWKNYGSDSLSESALQELQSMNKLGFDNVCVSLSYRKYNKPDLNYLEDPRFEALKGCGNRVIFHNIPGSDIALVKSKGFSIFL